MDDDLLIEQSAQQIMRQAPSAASATKGGMAEESGFQAVNNVAEGTEMDQSWKYRGHNQNPHGDDGGAHAMQMADNRSVLEAKRKIEDIGELDWNDMIAMGMSDGNEGRANAMAIGQVVNHVVNQGAQQVVQNAYMNPNEASMIMEEQAYQPMQQADGWGVIKRSATLKSGKQIPVFMVEDSVSGMTTGKKFRLSAVAEKVARVLNATGNPDDPRIAMIEKAYDRHVQYMRELGAAKKSGNAQKVRMIESKLSEVNASLGID